MLASTSQKLGYLYKQGKGGTKKYKQRWFILWRHPLRKTGDFAFLWYDEPDSLQPNGFKWLSSGKYALEISDATKKKQKFEHRVRYVTVVAYLVGLSIG